jgi:hypothetical protein
MKLTKKEKREARKATRQKAPGNCIFRKHDYVCGRRWQFLHYSAAETGGRGISVRHISGAITEL